MSYRVTIAGRSLAVGKRSAIDFQWAIHMGVAAPLQLWKVPNEIASELVAGYAGKEIELRLDQVRVKRVILLANAPADDPYNQFIVLTDVRWYYTRKWLAFDANIKREVGDTQLLGNQLSQVAYVPTVVYLPHSINQGTTPYNWQTLAERALRLSESASDMAPKIQWTLDAGGLNVGAKVVEERVTDSPMPTGLARAIMAIPGRSMYPDLNGVVHVCDAVPGREKTLVDRARGLRVRGHGDMTWVDLRGTRPAKGYKVFFTPKYEMRVDYDSTKTYGKDDFYFEPVVKIPDPQLPIPASAATGRAARTVGLNSWVVRQEAYDGWGDPGNGVAPGKLSDDVVRDGYLNDCLTTHYIFAANKEPDLIWGRRIDRVIAHWRRSFRVNPRAWERVLHAELRMSAVWDTVTGTRAPSPVYVNQAKRYNERWLVAQITRCGVNDTKSYPASGKLVDGIPNAVEAVWADQEQGIITFLPDMDQLGGLVESIQDVCPSQVEQVPDADPDADPAGQGRIQVWDGNIVKPVAESSFKLATIISLVPAAPNDMRRLYSVDVTLEQAASAIGLVGSGTTSGSSGVPTSTGPGQELRSFGVQPRFAWQDEQDVSDQIKAAFGIGVDPTISDATIPKLKPINYGSEVQPSAIALAGADIFSKLDHYEGKFAVPQDAGYAPIGSLAQVVHRVGRKFSQTILVGIPNGSITPNPLDLLPASVRTVLLRLVVEK